MCSLSKEHHTINSNSKCIFFSELCPFLDLDFFIVNQAPHSRVLAPVCGAFVLYVGPFQSYTTFDWLYHKYYFQMYKFLQKKRKNVLENSWEICSICRAISNMDPECS